MKMTDALYNEVKAAHRLNEVNNYSGRNMFGKFHLSDYVAQNNPGWRVRWGPQNLNAVLLVKQSDNDQWKLVWTEEKAEVVLNVDKRFVIREGVELREKTIRISESKPVGRIIDTCNQQVLADEAAPRHINEEPYITSNDSNNFEKLFFEKLVSPYRESHKLYAISRSGVELLRRHGITDYTTIYVNHYDSATYQDDQNIEVEELFAEPDDLILIVDDMVSSGWTAKAVLDEFENMGCQKVRFAALFNVQASRECEEVSTSIDTLLDVSNCYWIYGRGMDLNDESSRLMSAVFGADKQFDWETEEDINDLFSVFNQ